MSIFSYQKNHSPSHYNGTSSLFRLFVVLIFFVSIWNTTLAQNTLENDELSLDDTPASTPAQKKTTPLPPTPIQKAFIEKNFAKVITLGENKVAEISRDDLLCLGKAYIKVSNLFLAQKTLSTGVSRFPKDFEVKTEYANTFFLQNKEKDAITVLKEILEKDKGNMFANQLLIQIYEKKNNKYELRLIYEDLVAIHGEKIEFIEKLCELNATDKMYDIAKSYCKKAIALHPNSANNYVYNGVAYQDSGFPEEAERNYKLAADSFSKSELAQITYAQFLEEKKSYVEAHKYYGRALAINNKSFKALAGSAQMSFELQKLDEALATFYQACKIDRKVLPAIRKSMAFLLKAKNDKYYQKYSAMIDKCN